MGGRALEGVEHVFDRGTRPTAVKRHARIGPRWPLIEPVDDPGDPRLADYVGLPDAELRRRIEAPSGRSYGFFIAEGTTAIRRLLASPYRTRSVLVTPAKPGRSQDALAGATRRSTSRRPRCSPPWPASTSTAARWPRPTAPPPLAVADVLAGRRTVARARRAERPREPRRPRPQRDRAGVDGPRARPDVRRPALPPLRPGVDGRDPAPPLRPGRPTGPAPSPAVRPRRVPASSPSRPPPRRHRSTWSQPRTAPVAARARAPRVPAWRPATLAAADLRVRIPIAAGIDSLNVGHAAAIAFHCFARR